MNQIAHRAPLGTRWANIVFGIWVLVSPFVFGFSQNPIAVGNNMCLGVAFVLVALAGEWGQGGFLALTVPLSIWLFLWPFVFGFWGTPLLWSNVLMTFAQIAAACVSEGLRTPPSQDTTART